MDGSAGRAAVGEPPDPGRAASMDELVADLRSLKAFAGVSYATVVQRVNMAWRRAGRLERTQRSTVAGYFRLGRSRLDEELLSAIVNALHPDPDYVRRWRRALCLIRREATAAAVVDVRAGLPGTAPGFVGRAAELDLVRRAAATGSVATIQGMAGVGKTALALHAAHRLLAEDRYRDLQLFVDLRGFHPTAPPADPAAVLAEFLRHLGVPAEKVPLTLAGRVAEYRARLRGRCALVVLDNAIGAADVEPLLPPGDSCFTVITSRSTLGDLPAAGHVRLGVLPAAEAVALLRSTAGDERVDADPAAAARIAAQAGYLPLGLSIVGGHLRDHPDWLLSDCLDSLTGLAMEGGVRAALALSDQRLAAGPRRLLRLLAMHLGPSIEECAAAALAGQPVDTTRAQLAALDATHLLQEPMPGRYTLHDLVRAYAAERVGVDEPPSRTRQALVRLRAFYRDRAAAAVAATTVDNAGPARSWLAAERDNLVATALTATDVPRHVLDTATILHRYLIGTGRLGQACALLDAARLAARRLQDRPAEAAMLRALAEALRLTGDFTQAVRHLRRALTIDRDAADPAGAAETLHDLGEVYRLTGDFGRARTHLRRALTLQREVGVGGEARTLFNLGELFRLTGHLAQARAHVRQALDLSRATGDRTGEATAEWGLGKLYHESGDTGPAEVCLTAALTIFHELGNRVGEAITIRELGAVAGLTGDHATARERMEEALTIHRDMGNAHGEAWALYGLAGTDHAVGDHARARDHLDRALGLMIEVGDQDGRIDVLNTLAQVLHTTGPLDDAAATAEEALRLATTIGYRRAQARALTTLGQCRHALGDTAGATGYTHHADRLFAELGLGEPVTRP